ncbi:MAG: NAD(P)/FAD-dependent oxidoreductase [Pelagimonas sp.]|jgi:digeranylgeranylglycerophospholipid reductase|nr:NAD(P)/FAD-dependent oxidoreductase [Pelagimonas sp.]
MMECDVLIVGGGPAGLSVAQALPSGVSSIVVHQDREIGLPVRTSGGTWQRDMQALGVPEHLYHIIDKIQFLSDHAEVERDLSDWKMAVLDVTGLYKWIGAQAQENGAQILTGTKFLTAEHCTGGQICTARSRDGQTFEIKSKYLVDASGVQHAVLTALGLRPKPTRIGVGIEYDYHVPQGVSNTAVLLMGKHMLGGYGWIFPGPNNTLRVGVGVIQPDVDTSPKALITDLITPEFEARHGLQLGSPFRKNAGLIPSAPYDPKLVFGKIIRTGDSANFATPTVGEGIRQAIEFGRLLGHALGKSIAEGQNAPLKAYERAARRRFARDYRFGFLSNRRMATYTPSDWDRSVARVTRLSEHEMAALLRSEFAPGMLVRTLAKQVAYKIRRSITS